MIDINRLTLGEIAKIEELSGQPISAIGEDSSPKGLSLAALAFVAKRREDPKFSWNAAQELTIEDANTILGLGAQEETDAPLDGGSPEPEEAPAGSRSKK